MSEADISEKQRENFRKFMEQHKLTASSWAKKSGVAEATIRHFLSGRNKSITTVNMEKLAKSVDTEAEIILNGHTQSRTYIKIYKELFIQSFIDVNKFIDELGLKLEPAVHADVVLVWYELAHMKLNQESESSLEPFKDLVKKLSSK